MAFSEDLADFINLDTPGSVAATIGAATVVGLFDGDYRDVLGVAGSAPVLTIPIASVAAVSIGDAVVANATNYTVVGIHPDGTGLTRLILEAA